MKIIDDTNGIQSCIIKHPMTIRKYHLPEVVQMKNTGHISIYEGGLLDKKEVYNSSNKLLSAEQTNYNFEDISGAIDYQLFILMIHGLLKNIRNHPG
ncbi:hypothetical protein EJ377_04465 [Chryseobacterium arthrosphaerae]|uniref:Uncharacterized protein n=1 Tax=Chryseobacterium arthrosphaerae TaxID=651561 RepID=A0A3S0QI85_9FLAO|nr:hypothetical protein EJ377_04465 [Chryseobacterium arthrosphaerae]